MDHFLLELIPSRFSQSSFQNSDLPKHILCNSHVKLFDILKQSSKTRNSKRRLVCSIICRTSTDVYLDSFENQTR